MSQLNLEFSDFTLDAIEEEYNEGVSFGDTFTGAKSTDLTVVTLDMTTADDTSYSMRIEPIRKLGYYGGYEETGRGLSTEILVDLIKICQDSRDLTFKEFFNRMIDSYAVDYKITITRLNLMTFKKTEYVPMNTVLIADDDEQLKKIKNIKSAIVLDLDKISYNNDLLVFEDKKIAKIAKTIFWNNHRLTSYGKLDYSVIASQIFYKVRPQNLIVIDRHLNIDDDVFGDKGQLYRGFGYRNDRTYYIFDGLK